MSELGKKLFALQLSYIETMMTPSLFTSKVKKEIEGVMVWGRNHTFGELFSEGQWQSLVHASLLAPTLNETVVEARVSDALVFLSLETHATATWGDLLEESRMREFLTFLSGFSDVQHLVIRQLISSPAYQAMISDVVYASIRGFVMEGNFLSRLPGFSSLLRVGKWGMSKAVPNVEEVLENTAKVYIKNNIQRLSLMSEKMIERHLTPENIDRIGLKLWGRLQGQSVALLMAFVEESYIRSAVGLQAKVWEHLKAQPYFHTVIEQYTKAWYQKNQTKTLYDLWCTLGISESTLLGWVEQWLEPVMHLVQKDQFLIGRIRHHLEDFYETDAVKDCLREQIFHGEDSLHAKRLLSEKEEII
jgi:hypothetical protein